MPADSAPGNDPHGPEPAVWRSAGRCCGKKPETFGVTGVIKGWTEALQLMPVGSKFKIYLPQSIAYGAIGAGEIIKPYSTLIFEVELLEIVK